MMRAEIWRNKVAHKILHALFQDFLQALLRLYLHHVDMSSLRPVQELNITAL